MLPAALAILAGVGLLSGGADALVRGGTSLGRRVGLSPLAIGLTVIAFGTSTPELFVSVGAAFAGTGGIAVGNVVGSNIANIALILGLTALIAPPRIHSRILRFDLPILVATSLLLVYVLRDDRMGRLEGIVLLGGLALYTVWNVLAAGGEVEEAKAEFARAAPPATRSAASAGLLVAGGLALLMLGARILIAGAVSLAQSAGVSDVTIGLTIVAVGTSLPELATSVVAALRGESDVAVGNVIGSNMFNILGVLGASSLVAPLEDTGLGAVDLRVMVLLAIVLLPLMRTGFRVSRGEGLALLAAYTVYVAHLLR